MARFCTRCGRPLEEGEVCNCGQEAAPQQQQAQQQQVAQEAAPQQQQAQQQQVAQEVAPQFQQQAQQGYAQNSQQFQQTQQAVTGFLGKMFGFCSNMSPF